MKFSLSPLDRISIQTIFPDKLGKYTGAICEEIIEVTKLSPEELEEYQSEQGPDFPAIDKLRKGEEKEIELKGWAVKFLQGRFAKLAEGTALELYQYKLWKKMFPKEAAADLEAGE